MNVDVSTLANGLTVATCPMPEAESVAVGIWVGVGGRHESERLSGVSHFIEHLLFKGTRRRSARAISQAIEGRGGYLNAFTQEENTCYYARVGHEHTGHAFDVLVDMYANPLFAETDIRKECEVIVEEIAMYEDQPQHVVQEMLGQALWVRHPLGRPLTGSAATLRAMTRADILGYKQAGYVPANTAVVMAGRLTHADSLHLVERHMGDWARGRKAGCRKLGDRVPQQAVRAEQRDIEQAQLAVGYRCFGRRDPRRHILRILNVVLGENMSSRLFQTVREKHGLAYAIHSGLQLFHDTGALYIAAGLERKSYLKTLALIMQEIRRMRAVPVGPRELARAKDYAIGQTRLGLEGTNSRMMWVGESLMTHGKYVPPEHSIEKLQQVTAEDVQGMANLILDPAQVSLALLVPELRVDDRERAAELIAGGGAGT